jgi:selenocysteine-specific elongation factor
LSALTEPDPGDALERLAAALGVTALPAFAQSRNLPQSEIEELAAAAGLRRLGSGEAAIAVTSARLAELADRVVAVLGEWHRAQPDSLGPGRGALLARLRGQAPEAALEAALEELIAQGRAVRDRAAIRLPEHQPRLSREDERLWRQIEPLLAAGGLRPPRVREIAAELGLEPEAANRLLKRFERFGRLAQVAPNRFYLPETIAELADIAAALAAEAPGEGFTAVAFKDRSGIGRNVTIEVLEYLDSIGITRRQGETRVVLRQAAEVFG